MPVSVASAASADPMVHSVPIPQAMPALPVMQVQPPRAPPEPRRSQAPQPRVARAASPPSSEGSSSGEQKGAKRLSNGRYQCLQCGKVYADKAIVWRHRQKVHEHIQYCCTNCGKDFSSRYNRIRHEKICPLRPAAKQL